MTALSEVSGSPRSYPRTGVAFKTRRYAVSDGAPVEVVEDGPGVVARLAWLAARLTIRPVLTVGSYAPNLPWPWGIPDLLCRAIAPTPGTVRARIGLEHCTADLIRAKGVLPADGTRRVVLYMHGGAFLTCGTYTHGPLMATLSQYADSPVLAVDYRMLPKHSVGEAIDDCYDGYQWLRRLGYEPDQIVLAGDSAGGYLSLALAERLLDEGERPAAIVGLSPLMEIDPAAKQAHPNIASDGMFSARVFDVFAELIADAARRRVVDGRPEEVYEPLDHVEPGLPPTLIHVSGSEALLHDARLAARTLAAAGVPVEVRVWPGQLHVFQIAAPILAEGKRSLRQIGEYIREATG